LHESRQREELCQIGATGESGVVFPIGAVVQQCSEDDDGAAVGGAIMGALDRVEMEREG